MYLINEPRYLFVAVALAILATMSLALFRAAVGPTVFDRILAVNTIGTKTVLLIAIVVFMTDRKEFLDLALLYSLINFIGTVAVLRFSKYDHFDEIESDVEATS